MLVKMTHIAMKSPVGVTSIMPLARCGRSLMAASRSTGSGSSAISPRYQSGNQECGGCGVRAWRPVCVY